MSQYTVDPIGFFHTSSVSLYDVPRQSSLNTGNTGVICLQSGSLFEQALEGLEGFDRIWVVFRFHRHNHWKPKVLPPRGGKKQGVFSTRSPHRPNFIGLSCVELRAVRGLKLFIENHDLIDGTPILDLKPYLNYADSFVSQRQGWLDELPPLSNHSVSWSSLADEQVNFLGLDWNCHLKEGVEHRLKQSPYPYPNNRVKEIKKGVYELAYRTWRIYYRCQNEEVIVTHIRSGYDDATLKGEKKSKWDDVLIHKAFVLLFKDDF